MTSSFIGTYKISGNRIFSCISISNISSSLTIILQNSCLKPMHHLNSVTHLSSIKIQYIIASSSITAVLLILAFPSFGKMFISKSQFYIWSRQWLSVAIDQSNGDKVTNIFGITWGELDNLTGDYKSIHLSNVCIEIIIDLALPVFYAW